MHFFADCVYPKSIPSHRFTPSRPRVPHPSRVFCERVGIGDSTARVIATLRDHHDQGCPILLASFARGWGLGIPPPELSRRCGTITTKSAPPFSRLLREGGDWGFHRATYSDAAEPSQPRVPHPSRVFCERVGIADSTARLTATLRNHHNRGCPTLLASFARGWGLGIPPPELSQRCGTITTKGAPSFSRLLREGGDWGFHRTTYSDAAEPSRPRVPHPSRVFARGWGLGIPPPELSRRCGTITTESAPPFSRLLREGGDCGFHRTTYSDAAEPSQSRVPHPSRVFCERVGIGDSTARVIATLRNHHNRGCPTLLACLREGGDWGFHRTTYSDAAEPSQPRVPHPSRVFVRGWGFDEPKDLRPPNPSPNSRI